MVIDIICITLLLAFFVRGYSKGIVIAIFSLVALVLGVICALKLSASLASYLFTKGWVSSGWAQIISYALLFVAVVWLVRWGGNTLQRLLEKMSLGLINRIAGGLLYAFVGAFIWSSFLWLGNQVHAIAPETLVASKTYQYITPIAPWVVAHVSEILPFAKSIFSDLEQFFDNINKQLPEHVGFN
jgi:membrane protein required for colicin V production